MGDGIWSIYNHKYFEIEHFTRKINKTYSHLVCPLLFLAISAILACFPYHCYSWTERVSSRNSVLRHRMRDAYMNKSFAFFSRREFGIPVVNVKDSLV